MTRLNMLLIHGWDYHNYNSLTKSNLAWSDQNELINNLSLQFNIYRINLPGFFGQEEPKAREWYLDDYADYIEKYLNTNLLNIDVILGYSFGSLVAIKWKTKYKRKTKLALISPPIIRNEIDSQDFIQTPGFLRGIRNKLRNAYVIKFDQTEEMVNGTTFLQNTYQNIIRINMLMELLKVPVNDLLILFGENDQIINISLIYNSLPMDYKSKITIIKGGSHDLINTNYQEIINYLMLYINPK